VDVTDTHAKATRFREMHLRPEVLVLPNPWDIGTARLLQHLGFEALATTSAGFAHSVGRPDGGVSRVAALAHAADLAATTDLPVSADLENCFADDPAGVAATVVAATETGVVGCSVEDATGRTNDPIYDFELAVERVTAAVEAAKSAGFPFTVTARAENFLHDRPDLEDTIARLQAFAAAGADVVYAPGISEPKDVAMVVESVSVPVNVLALPGMTVAQLEDLGVARVSIGSGLSRAAFGAFYAGATELIERGTFGYGWKERPFVDLNGIFQMWAD
jgi:2-methylisocitrate lyase-like PEP mutase family enzyme